MGPPRSCATSAGLPPEPLLGERERHGPAALLCDERRSPLVTPAAPAFVNQLSELGDRWRLEHRPHRQIDCKRLAQTGGQTRGHD
ncbi:MAG: hypothetical protein DMF89_07240 [Acidobacteria bacterium]|nr:MAG: hypothetical protein DMF89_07240 [Acidobacteriota bacterium]